jgi:shikimate dehydrogenase
VSALVRLTGATRLYGIVGDPIAQVRSPEVFTQRFADAGIDAVLIPLHVPAAQFDAAIKGLLGLGNLDGLLVTVPFKPAMVRHADRIGPVGQQVGAINALRREADGTWTGEMFDGAGFVRALEHKRVSLAGRHVAQFGAGGVGSAIACALAQAGVAAIDLIDVERARAQRLAERLHGAFPAVRFAVAPAASAAATLIVNASPVGMSPGDGLPGALGELPSGTVVGDVVITPTPTALVRLAHERGLPWVDGKDMHSGQVDTLLAFFAAATRTPDRR